VLAPALFSHCPEMLAQDRPKKLPDKLKQIRARTGLTKEQFAPQVNAKNARSITAYESGTEDMPISVLLGYWKLSGVPLQKHSQR
jgi:DNA-binding XRE family transcriptional regulator